MLQGRHLSAVFVFYCLMGLSFAAHSVPLPDLIATKTNTAPASQIPQGGSFEWHVELSNIGNAGAQFSKGNVLLIDQLPSVTDTAYGIPTASSTSVDCTIVPVFGYFLVTCTATKDFVLDPQSSIDIVIPVQVADSTLPQDMVNPNSPEPFGCSVDFSKSIEESDETNNDCAPNTVTILKGAISLAKTVMLASGECGADDQDSLDIKAPGDVTYCYKVTNKDVARIDGLTVSDDLLGLISGCSAALEVGASTTCTINKTVTQAEIDAGTEIVNRGTASATSVAAVTDTATLTFNVLAMTLEKKVMLNITDASCEKDAKDSLDISAPGHVTYCYKLTNTGNVVIHGLYLYDDKLGSISGGDGLLVGQTSTRTKVKTVTQAEINKGTDIVNTGTAGADGIADEDVVTDTATLTFTQKPAISLAKTVMLAGKICGTDDHDSLDISAPGDVTYCYEVSNTGNVSIDGLTVNDDLLGPITGCSPALTVGTSTTCTKDKTVTQAEIDASTNIVNTGTASATTTGAADATDIARLTFSGTNQAISLEKTAKPTTYRKVDDTISYSYVVTNDGKEDLAAGAVSVADDKVSVTCPDTLPVAPDATVTCTAEYSITQDDLDAGFVVNTAIAKTKAGITSKKVSATVNAVSIKIVKSANPESYVLLQEIITYHFHLENTGSLELTDVKVTDPLPGLSAIDCGDGTHSIASLPPSGTGDCEATYDITQADIDAQHVANTASVSAKDPYPLGKPVTASDQVVILEENIKCEREALIIPDGEVFTQDTALSSETSISTETLPTFGVIVEKPSTLTLVAPKVEFNPQFRVKGGGRLKVVIDKNISC